MTLLFVILVVAGFVFHFLATFGVNYATRIAWGLWLAAAVLWAIPLLK
ncbi:MAG: hypothetical protein ACRED8_03900 [Caulobacteraceae bacterium]